MKFKCMNAFGAGLLLSISCLVNVAYAGLIIGPVDVEVSEVHTQAYSVDIDNLINQSGLSANYISGVTDFASFTATTTASNTGSGFGLGGVLGLGSFYFDLGAMLSIDAIATWGQGGGGGQVNSYALYASDQFGSLGSRLLIGNFGAGSSQSAYIHNFGQINSRYFEIDVLTNGGYEASRFSDVVFSNAQDVPDSNAQEVPEPSTLAIFALGMIGLASRRFKK